MRVIALPLGGNLDVLDRALRCRERQAVFAQAIQMEFDGLADLAFGFFGRSAGRNATRKIRNVGGVVAFCFLYDNGVSHWNLTFLDPLASGCCLTCLVRNRRLAFQAQSHDLALTHV